MAERSGSLAFFVMKKTRIHILSAVNAANVSKTGSLYTIKDVCGAVDGIVMNSALYPAEELRNSAASLDGKPAPAGHPKDGSGRYISALNGSALLNAYIGSVCTNARHEGGRTLVDIMVNEAQAKAHPDGAKLIERLDAAITGNNADPIHVSTGLFCKMLTANGESGGKKYSRIATGIQYDHLAILLNERGAGTPADGVGMFLNADGQEVEVETVEVNEQAIDRRFEGVTGWIRKLLGNSDLSFDQIYEGLRSVLNTNEANAAKAEKSLKDAIALHEKHMNGTAPTTGADGEKSQMKMMRLMKAALDYLTGKEEDAEQSDVDGNSKNKPKVKGMGGMKMNADNQPADRRNDGLNGWIRKLLGNSDLSFDQICKGLRAVLPEGAWPREVFAKYCIYMGGDDRLYKQDYTVDSGGSVALLGQPVEVLRKVEYEPVTNSNEVDTVKDKILAALNAAGIKTEGLDEAQLLTAYNAMVSQPVQDKLNAANTQIATFEANARASQEAEVSALAAELAVNSALSVDDLKKLGADRLKELKANAHAAPITVGGTKQGKESEFSGYSLNSLIDEKKEA